jgi:hypothetical protein
MTRLWVSLVAAILAAGAAGAVGASPLPPLEDFGRLPAMSSVTLSPSGQRYAFVAEVAGVRKLYVATTANRPIESDDIGSPNQTLGGIQGLPQRDHAPCLL